MDNEYINSATAALVEDLHKLIAEDARLAHDQTVSDAFTQFRRTCATVPSIVGYISKRLSMPPTSNIPCFSPQQIEILMLGVIARASSTYGTIPSVVAHLALVGEHAHAAILNENAKNETGDRGHAPHPILLFDCFKVIGEALSLNYLTPASYHILRYILIERGKTGAPSLRDVESVKHIIARNEPHFPTYNDDDISVALYYSTLCQADIARLHSLTIKIESRMDDRGSMTNQRNPYDKHWLATRRLELALREASSVDEHDTGRLSYIGSWGRVVENLIPQIRPNDHERARAWAKAHNDEGTGQAVGWPGAAEEGHAMDARLQAMQMMRSVTPEIFASVLSEVTTLHDMRLAFWDDLVEDLLILDEVSDAEASHRTN